MMSLDEIPELRVIRNAPLSEYTRFGIGGPADFYAETRDEGAFRAALNAALANAPSVVIGGGTNLIVSDDGFPGVVLRYTGQEIREAGELVEAEAGGDLQRLVDYTVDRGLAGLHTMTGIPGTVGAAIYGNAGAYGHAICESVEWVRFFDGEGIRTITNAECEFRYRESIFKRNKRWVIFSAGLRLPPGDPAELRKTADEILAVRNRKYPPAMKCAGSIFKNLLLAELPPETAAMVPESIVREGKVASAFFLEQAGAKGLRVGDIQVAGYHANLIYNDGRGTAKDLVKVINELKARVRDRFGLELEEEVQYVGFSVQDFGGC